MADENVARKACARARSRAMMRSERGRGIGGFVDVEVEVPALALGEREQRCRAPPAGAGSYRSPRRGCPSHAPRPSPRHRAICASSNAKSMPNSGDACSVDAAAPALARLGEHRPADRGSAGRRCRYGCGSRACRARRRSAGRTPCARATSPALQLAAGRPRPWRARRRKSPVGLGARGQIWPLSRWVWASTNSGSTMRRRAPGAARRVVGDARRPARSRRCGPRRSGDRPRAKPSRSTRRAHRRRERLGAWRRASA